MTLNKITLLLATIVAPAAIASGSFIIRAPIEADLSQWQIMPPDFSDWESISEPYNCSAWSPDTFTVHVGESFTQEQSCSQDFERTVTVNEYDNFTGEVRVVSEETETDTQSIENSRDASGTREILEPEESGWINDGEAYDCTEWTPNVDTVAAGTQFDQARSCSQDQSNTTTIWAEDISTGEREIEDQFITEQTITTSETQTAIGTKIVRNMCVDILSRGESTGNGVYSVFPEGGTARNAYCDMSGGGWTLYDSFGSQLVHTGGANPSAYNGNNINSTSGLSSAGYTYYLDIVNTTSYHTSPFYMQMFYGGHTRGWAKKVMPSWVDGVKVEMSNAWYQHESYVHYGSETQTIWGYQGHTEFVFSGGGKELKLEDYKGIIWADSVWVK